MYRLFDHTADVGIHVEAQTLPELFADAGRALVSLLVDEPAEFRAVETQSIELRAARSDDLLFDFLGELLYRFSTDGYVPVHQEIETDGERLRAELRGERFDPDRHRGGSEVKAITYHGLKLEPTADGYVAEVIVDI